MAIKRQEIMTNLLTALRAINGTGSYYTDVSSNVYEHRVAALQDNELPALVVRDIDTMLAGEDLAGSSNQFTLRLGVEIQALLKEAWSNAATARQMVIDIFRALNADTTLSGKAIDINYESDAMLFEGEQNARVVAGAVVKINIVYQTKRFEES